jgi:hypothetical protein
MKKIILLTCTVAVLTSCLKKDENKIEDKSSVAYAVFGDSITAEGAFTKEEMFEKFKSLKEGDTLDVKFISKSKAVCQKKGCWMSLELPEANETFVKFKDYAFFVPKNAENEEVIVKGKAYVSIESVDELKHYAKDAGKSKAAIDSIVNPKTTYSFMAEGVLIKK